MERRKAAERELAEFRSTLEGQREKRRESNREHDTQLADEIEEAKRRKDPWERVNNLVRPLGPAPGRPARLTVWIPPQIDVGRDSATQTKDISVMRKVGALPQLAATGCNLPHRSLRPLPRQTVIRMKQNPVLNYSAHDDAEASS